MSNQTTYQPGTAQARSDPSEIDAIRLRMMIREPYANADVTTCSGVIFNWTGVEVDVTWVGIFLH